jgi:hypothetical protein
VATRYVSGQSAMLGFAAVLVALIAAVAGRLLRPAR